jgi:hypothetical protein
LGQFKVGERQKYIFNFLAGVGRVALFLFGYISWWKGRSWQLPEKYRMSACGLFEVSSHRQRTDDCHRDRVVAGVKTRVEMSAADERAKRKWTQQQQQTS